MPRYPVKILVLPRSPGAQATHVPGFVLEQARNVDDARAQARERLAAVGTLRALNVGTDGQFVAVIEK